MLSNVPPGRSFLVSTSVNGTEYVSVSPWSGSLHRIHARPSSILGVESDRRFSIFGIIRSTGERVVLTEFREVHGRFLVARIEPTQWLNSNTFPTADRRANQRFPIPRHLPIQAYVRGAGGSVSVLNVKDVSAGGALLFSCGPSAPLMALTKAECRFETHGLPPFKAHIAIASRESSQDAVRIGVSFLDLSESALRSIVEYLRRSSAEYDASSLSAERILNGSWAVEKASLPSRQFLVAEPKMEGRFLKAERYLARSLCLSPRMAICPLLVWSGGVRPGVIGPTTADTSALNTDGLFDLVNNGARTSRRQSLRSKDAIQLVHPHSIAVADESRAHITSRGPRSSVHSERLRKRIIRAKQSSKSVSWTAYAVAYDLMSRTNVAYADNLRLFCDWLPRFQLHENSVVCDIGAGTGNYLLEVSRHRPNATLVHLDSDPRMNALASQKYRCAGVRRVTFERRSIVDAVLPQSSLDLVICVNALYTFPSRPLVLKKILSWLKPGGYFFSIDLGREMDVGSWTRFILSDSLEKSGLTRTLKRLWLGRHAISQNSAIRDLQRTGGYWLHQSTSFQNQLEDIGFDTVEAGVCYRGYCDYAVCSRPLF